MGVGSSREGEAMEGWRWESWQLATGGWEGKVELFTEGFGEGQGRAGEGAKRSAIEDDVGARRGLREAREEACTGRSEHMVCATKCSEKGEHGKKAK